MIPATVRILPINAKKAKAKPTQVIIADATDRLLLATKTKILKEEGRAALSLKIPRGRD